MWVFKTNVWIIREYNRIWFIISIYFLWYEVVEAVKEDRGVESGIHRFMANLFYKIISKLTDINMMNALDFKLLDRKVMLVLLNMKEILSLELYLHG